MLIFLASSALAAQATSGDLPTWITKGPVSDTSFHYVVCSHDGIDPEEARQIAESKCLASAAKLGGVSVRLTQKTVQSLTGSDSSEVAEIQPLEVKIKCEWTDRFLEKVESGFRVWLRCRLSKKSVREFNPNEASIWTRPNDQKEKTNSLKHKRAILNIATVPTAERLIILADDGERAVVEVKKNTQSIELKEGDKLVIIKKQKYQDEKVYLGSWENGESISKTVYLKPEM